MEFMGGCQGTDVNDPPPALRAKAATWPKFNFEKKLIDVVYEGIRVVSFRRSDEIKARDEVAFSI